MFRIAPSVCALFTSCFFCLLVNPNGHASAQTIPGSADIGHLSKSTRPSLQPKILPNAKTEDTTPHVGDISIEGAEQVAFQFNGLTLKGMDAYPAGHFDYLFAPLVGKKVSLQEVINVINTINQLYRQDGFILSGFVLPEQDITSGYVTVDIIEGRILNVVPAADNPNAAVLAPYFQKISQIYPFNIREFEHMMLVLNTLSGAQFKGVLRQPENKMIAGGIDIAIVEDRLPAEINITLNNFGSQYAGPWQAMFNTSHSSVLAPYDNLKILLSTTYPTKEVKYGEVNYAIPLYSFPGVSFKAGINWGGTHSGSTLKELDLSGLSREGSLGLSYNHLLSRRTNWVSEVGFRAKDTRSKVLGDELYDDRLRVARASTTWQHLDNFKGVTLVNTEISHGMDILGARKSRSFNLSRADGRSDFTKLTFQASRLQTLSLKVQGFLQISGQYSFTPVLSAEEFGYGGVPLGRGLDPSEITGDHGFSMSTELRYTGIPEYRGIGILPYAFVDFGKVWQKGDSAANSQTALTAGIGGRISYNNSTTLDMLVALPLTHKASNPPKYGNAESLRYLISLSKNF